MSAFIPLADKTIALAADVKTAARFDSLSPLHHKSPFTIDLTMIRPVTRAKEMTRIFGQMASGRVQ